MKHQNKAFKHLLSCTEASSASVNTFSKRIWRNDKNKLVLHAGFLPDFHFNVAIMAALWLMLFVSFISLHSEEHQHCATTVLKGLIQNTHLCFLGVTKVLLATGVLFKMIVSFLAELLLCPFNPCKTGMRRMALVFISHVNYLYQLLCWPLSGWRWEMSPHIMATSRRHVVWAFTAMKGGGSKTVAR